MNAVMWIAGFAGLVWYLRSRRPNVLATGPGDAQNPPSSTATVADIAGSALDAATTRVEDGIREMAPIGGGTAPLRPAYGDAGFPQRGL